MSMTRTATDAKGVLLQLIRDQSRMYAEDLRAMSEEQLGSSPGGVARPPYDFTHEVSLFNVRVSKRLKFEDPGPWPSGDGAMTAPAENRNPEATIATFESSVTALLDALEDLAPDRLGDKIVLEKGETSPIELLRMVVSHLAYHDGQLNLIQLLNGDDQVHWTFE